MSEVKRKLRNSKQTDLADVTEGPQTKKRKSPAKPNASNKKTKQENSASGAGLTQATVEDMSAAKASKTDAKLVDPNTGAEVHMSPGPDAEQNDSNKPKHNAKKGSNKKDAALVDPNTGSEVDAAATVQSKPATKQGRKKQVKDEAKDDQAGPSGSAQQDAPAGEVQYVKINRAPVLTLWVAVVAERQGFSKEAGLTFGKAISGMLAQSKGRSIGVFDKKDTDDAAKLEREEEEHRQGIAKHDVFGMSIKAKDVGDDGDVRALDSNMQAMNHKQAEGYLQRAFGERLQDAKSALEKLAHSYKAEEIGEHCYHLYEQFRPSVASGQKGWGQKGQLDLAQIHHMAQQH